MVGDTRFLILTESQNSSYDLSIDAIILDLTDEHVTECVRKTDFMSFLGNVDADVIYVVHHLIQKCCREVILGTLREFYLVRDTERNSHPAHSNPIRKAEASVLTTRLNLKEQKRRPQLLGSIIPRGLWDVRMLTDHLHRVSIR